MWFLWLRLSELSWAGFIVFVGTGVVETRVVER